VVGYVQVDCGGRDRGAVAVAAAVSGGLEGWVDLLVEGVELVSGVEQETELLCAV
jgi:hypothetical protein